VLGAQAGDHQLEVTGNDARMFRGFGRLVLRARASAAEPYSVEIAPSGAVLAPGESRTFAARVNDRYGNTLTDNDITWTVNNSQVARVDSRGVVTGLGEGTTPFTAYTRTSSGSRVEGYGWIAVQGGTATPDTTVTAPTPDTTTVPDTTGTGAGEPPPTVTTPGRVSDLSVVSADESSVVISFTQVSDGTGGAAQYAVRRGSPSVDWWLTSGTERLIQGSQVGGRIEYRYSGLSAATPYEFQVVAYRGALSLGVLFGELSNKVAATTANAPSVGPVAVASVVASADSHQFAALNEAKTFTAAARDGSGAPLPGTNFNWSSLNSSIASVSGSGVVTARSNGATKILVASACCVLAVDTIAVTVAQLPTTVAVTPASVSLGVGQTRQLAATVLDANGNLVPGVSLQWSSTSPSVATVNASGLAAGMGAGNTNVRARFSGLTGTSQVQVAASATGSSGPPAMPSTITATPVSGGVNVAWGSVTGATYHLAWGPHDGSNGQTKSVTASPTTLTASGDGYVCVRAVANSLQSEPRCTSYSAGTTGSGAGGGTGSGGGSTGSGGGSTGSGGGGTTLPPPPPAPSGVFWQHDFGSYSSLSAISAVGNFLRGTVALQTGTLIDGSAGKFLRTTYNDGYAEAGVDLMPPTADARPREVWVEAEVRFGGNWQNASDDKSMFVMEDWRHAGGDSEVWRWAVYLRSSSFYGGPYHRLSIFPSSPSTVFDGQWHRLRVHYKMASNETATDGVYQVWIDGTLLENRQGIRTDSAPNAFFRVIALGRNADPASGATRDWGRVRMYLSNPGW
jgi:uncharacterized protein YjdB